MRLTEIYQRTLITERWNDPRLTLLETKYIIPFVQDVERYIVEAQLTPDQINQLFTNVEQGATAGGSNRTLVGKGKDAASFINKKIDELGAQLKKAGPVQNADAKFAELKAKIGATDSKVVKGIQAVSDWAKANPGKASIAVGILTVAASMAAGPLAGAITGFISRASKDLLQDKDLSTAAGGAVKTAAIGALAGGVADTVGLGGDPTGATATDTATTATDTATTATDTATTATDTATTATDTATTATDTAADSQQAPADVQANVGKMSFQGGGGVEYDLLDLKRAARAAAMESGKESQSITSGIVDAMLAQAERAGTAPSFQVDDEISSYVDQGIRTGKGPFAFLKNLNVPASESIILSHSQVVKLTENIMDTISGAGASLAGKAKTAASNVVKKGVGAAQQAGKNITTKITADKLLSAWKKAGSPTDSNKVYQVLSSAGVSDDVVEPVFKTMSIPFVKGTPKTVPPVPSSTTPSTTPRPSTISGQAPSSTTPSTTPRPSTISGQAPTTRLTYTEIVSAVANLTPVQAKELVTHIDSLTSATQSAAQPTSAVQPNQQTRKASLARTAQRTARSQQPTPAAPTAPAAPAAQPAAQPAAKPRVRAPATSNPVR